MQLSTSQQKFLDTALAGKNIFLTGEAGTGKSAVTKIAMDALKQAGRVVMALAPTGVAANNIGGQTIHSAFSIKPFGVASFETCNFMKDEKRRMMALVDTIFIDEVSMVRPDVLDAMEWTLLKNGLKGLRSKQIIFIGDMEQLEPVVKDNERSVMLRTYDGIRHHHSKIYPKLSVQTIELTEPQRQSDPDFISNLNIIRKGGKAEYFRQFVHDKSQGIVLAPHNSTVQQYNIDGLAKLPGPQYTFTATIEGNVNADDFNLPTVIDVKNGAKIMYLVNQQVEDGLVNGSLGIFVSHNDCHYIRVGEVDHALYPVRFVKKEYVLNRTKTDLELRELGSIEQYPIKLAYALSIHKAQGLTFDQVTVDLSRPTFAKGQMYVALSRVTGPKGLRIIVP